MDDVWLKVKNDYVCGLGTLPKLSEKYGIKIDTLKRRCAKEKWRDERTCTQRALHEKTVQKTVHKLTERLSDREADRLAKLLAVSDQLTEKLEQAVQELDKAQKVTKRKHRVSQKKEDEEGQPYYDEWTTEEEESQLVSAPVDRYGLRQLAATLKDLQAVAAYANGDDDSTKEIRVVIEGDDGGELSR